LFSLVLMIVLSDKVIGDRQEAIPVSCPHKKTADPVPGEKGRLVFSQTFPEKIHRDRDRDLKQSREFPSSFRSQIYRIEKQS